MQRVTHEGKPEMISIAKLQQHTAGATPTRSDAVATADRHNVSRVLSSSYRTSPAPFTTPAAATTVEPGYRENVALTTNGEPGTIARPSPKATERGLRPTLGRRTSIVQTAGDRLNRAALGAVALIWFGLLGDR